MQGCTPRRRRRAKVPTNTSRWTVRIVKKTLKGDLLGKTGFKKVGGRARPSEENGGPAAATPAAPSRPAGAPERERPGPAPDEDGFVIISDPLHPRHGKAPPLADAMPAQRRDLSPEERQAMAAAEADVAAASLGVTASAGGRRGNVAHVRDSGVPVAAPREPAASMATPAQAALAPLEPHGKPPATQAPQAPPPAPARPPPGIRLEGEAVGRARMVLAEALFRDFGAPGTKMQHPRGGSFQVQPRFGEGVVRTQHDLLLPLLAGHVAPHTADLVIELEPRGLLVLDVVASHVPLADLKARAFDALQLRRIDRCFSVLLFVRCPGAGMAQGQAEAIAHGYDVHFGIDEEHTHSEAKFQAVRARILQWLEAASAANRGAR